MKVQLKLFVSQLMINMCALSSDNMFYHVIYTVIEERYNDISKLIIPICGVGSKFSEQAIMRTLAMIIKLLC